MLYLVTWLTWLLVETGPGRRLGGWFPAALIAYVLLATAGATLNRGDAQFLAFHVSFGALEVFCLARVTWIALRPANRPVRAQFTVGLAAYATGIAVWFLDSRGLPPGERDAAARGVARSGVDRVLPAPGRGLLRLAAPPGRRRTGHGGAACSVSRAAAPCCTASHPRVRLLADRWHLPEPAVGIEPAASQARVTARLAAGFTCPRGARGEGRSPSAPCPSRESGQRPAWHPLPAPPDARRSREPSATGRRRPSARRAPCPG